MKWVFKMQYKGEQNRPKLRTHIFGQVFIIGVLLSCLFILPAISYYLSKLILQSSGTIGLDWLHTEGRSIVDSYGNTVILRGANFMGYEFGAWNSHTEADYAKMASWGFNVVRLPIAWHYVEPQPRIYNFSYFENYVDRDIKWAKKYGIYIILDMHQFYWSPHFTFFSDWNEKGNGLPKWTVSYYNNSADGLEQAIKDFWLGKGPNGTIVDETNLSLQDRFIEMWVHVASRYSSEPAIAAYDLFNEPFSASLPNSEHADFLYPFYERIVSRVRIVDNKHIIAYQPAPAGAITTTDARPIGYPNLIFSFHFSEFHFTYDGNEASLETMFDSYLDPVKDWNITIWIGEFNTGLSYTNSSL